MLRFGKLHRKTPYVNMIPVINVIFLLLIYFLMQGTFKNTEVIPVNAPISGNGKVLLADPVQLLVNSDSLYLADEKITQAELHDKLTELLHESPDKQLLIKADAQLDSTKFVSILRVVKQSGVTNVYMVTQSPPK